MHDSGSGRVWGRQARLRLVPGSEAVHGGRRAQSCSQVERSVLLLMMERMMGRASDD